MLMAPADPLTPAPVAQRSSAVLSLEGVSVAYGDRVVLADVSFAVPERGIFNVLGPVATGKSTILNLVANRRFLRGNARVAGTIRYCGAPLDPGCPSGPALVAQKAKLLLTNVLENMVSSLPERATLTKPQQRELMGRMLREAGVPDLADSLERDAVELSLSQQRCLAIVRSAVASPRLLCVDEPTANLTEEEAAPVLEVLRRQATQRAVMVITHSQRHARALGGQMVFLAGGVVHETGATEAFFTAPKTRAGEEQARTGSCSLPGLGTDLDSLDPFFVEEWASELARARAAWLEAADRLEIDVVTRPAPIAAQEGDDGVDQDDTPGPIEPEQPGSRPEVPSEIFGPGGFHWLRPGELAGTPWPGLIRETDEDLTALQRVGVTALISLTEKPFDANTLAPYGISGHWLAIPDMHAPTLDESARLCANIADLLAQGECIALHCRAGLGRTGTMLAAYLIWEGQTAEEALRAVRSVEQRWVQSEVQIEFLTAFATSVSRSS